MPLSFHMIEEQYFLKISVHYYLYENKSASI